MSELTNAIELDPYGFPMVWTESVQASVHWLPLTKLQFERFMCRHPQRRFHDGWYQDVCGLNKRVSPQQVGPGNYWCAFASGLLPSEGQAFQRSCGDDYFLPSIDEWRRACDEWKAKPPMPENWFQELGLTELVSTLFRRLHRVAADPTLRGEESQAKQMFFEQGVVEWVRNDDPAQPWVGQGRPNKAFNSRMSNPVIVLNSETARLKDFGVRLMRRPS